MQAPPVAWTAATTSPRQRSTVSIAVTAAGITPVWPTMSAFAKLMMPKRGSSSCHARTNAAAASGALICGLWSYVGTSRGEATSSRRSPAYGVSSPPLKKYVTCGYFSVSATCSCVAPRSASTCESVTVGRSGGNATGYGQPSWYSVIVSVALDRRRAAAVDLGEARIRQRAA